MKPIPFSPPDITRREVLEVKKALLSGWITTGPRVKKLEKELASFLGINDKTPNCVCLNSQTACGEIALRLFGIGPQEGGSSSDEVITCAYTYTASASVVCHVGAKLVLVDCQPNSLEMDYDALEKAINENTKAIIPVDVAGVPCDYDKIFEIVKKKQHLFKANENNKLQVNLNRIAIIEDSAHSLGATYKGRKIGSIADFSNFSFHAVKNFTTAEGGAICWNSISNVDDKSIYHQIQLYSLHGQSKDAFNKISGGSWEYDIVGPWYKCNMTDIAAAIGLIQLNRYPKMLEKRKTIIEKYNAAFSNLNIIPLDHYNDKHCSSGHLYIVRIPGINDEQRSEIVTQMKNKGVMCNVHYKPLPMHTAYKKIGFDINEYPNSYNAYLNEITLPLYTKLTNNQVNYIIKAFSEVVGEINGKK